MFLRKYLYSFVVDLFKIKLRINKTVVCLKCKQLLFHKVKRIRLTNIPVKAFFFYAPARFTVLKIEPSDPRNSIRNGAVNNLEKDCLQRES